MSRAALKRLPLRAKSFVGWSHKIHRVFLCLFAGALGLAVFQLVLPNTAFGRAPWPGGVLVLATAAATLSGLARSLPGQNVIQAAVIIGIAGSLAHVLAVRTGIPFGPIVFTEQIGPQLLPGLPWVIPFLWIIILLNARGIGRLVLRPWRKLRTYGFWLIGVTIVLSVSFALSLEPYAYAVRHLWLWGVSKAGLYWGNAPWVCFFGWAAISGLILAFATPSLINKKPVKSPPDYHPLIVWTGLLLLLAAGSGIGGQWVGLCFSLFTAGISLLFAFRGANW